MNWHMLEQCDTQNLETFVEAVIEAEILFEDGHQDVHADGDPHLSLHGVDRRAVEGLDAQVLFDPLEEQLNVPPAVVELRDLVRGAA